LEASGVEPRVKATVTNLGSRADSEVIEVYLGFPEGAGEPPKRLVAFRSVALAAGASQNVELALPARSFEVWDESAHRWHTPGGRYEVMVGRSSRDIAFRQSVVRP
jgi:beta-glucosidase